MEQHPAVHRKANLGGGEKRKRTLGEDKAVLSFYTQMANATRKEAKRQNDNKMLREMMDDAESRN